MKFSQVLASLCCIRRHEDSDPVLIDNPSYKAEGNLSGVAVKDSQDADKPDFLPSQAKTPLLGVPQNHHLSSGAIGRSPTLTLEQKIEQLRQESLAHNHGKRPSHRRTFATVGDADRREVSASFLAKERANSTFDRHHEVLEPTSNLGASIA